MRGKFGLGEGGSWLPFGFYGIPVVRAVLVATVAVFLAFFLTLRSGPSIGQWLAFSLPGAGGLPWYARPWTWFLYPVLETSPISLLCQGLWLWIVGGMLERSWGSRNFAAIFAALTLIAAAAFVAAHYLFGPAVLLAGLILPLSGLTVAWAALEPDMEVNLWGCLPLKAKLIALIDVLLVYFFFGFAYGPLIALFTVAAPAAAWIYVRKLPRLRLSFGTGVRRRPPLRVERGGREAADPETMSRPGVLRSRREREEIERLRKLLGDDDEGRPATRH